MSKNHAILKSLILLASHATMIRVGLEHRPVGSQQTLEVYSIKMY